MASSFWKFLVELLPLAIQELSWPVHMTGNTVTAPVTWLVPCHPIVKEPTSLVSILWSHTHPRGNKPPISLLGLPIKLSFPILHQLPTWWNQLVKLKNYFLRSALNQPKREKTSTIPLKDRFIIVILHRDDVSVQDSVTRIYRTVTPDTLKWIRVPLRDQHISSLIFINCVGLLVDQINPTKWIEYWFKKGKRTADEKNCLLLFFLWYRPRGRGPPKHYWLLLEHRLFIQKNTKHY